MVDSTEALAKFGPDAWDRVVCVMTTGQAWQFRPYKWTEPKTLFHHGMSLIPRAGDLRELSQMNAPSCSQGHLLLMDKRSSEPEDQGLERYRTQGASNH